MMVWLQSLLSAHALVVAVAAFAGISAILTAVGVYLQSIGDAVPGWLGTAISSIGSIIHFINGIVPPSK
jgi:hypothetical protein